MSDPSRRGMRADGGSHERWIAVLIGLAVVGAYFFSLSGDWVWDDIPQYRDNPAITDAWILVTRDIWGPTGQAQAGDLPVYRPLAMLTHAPLQTFLAGPASERVLNLALFLALLAGVAGLARALGTGPRAACFGAACLGFHPAVTESVAWISCRGELMGVGCVLAGTWALVRQKPWLAGGLLALAPFCKETFVLTPVAVAIWMVALRRRAWPTLALSALGVVSYLALRTGLGIALPAGDALSPIELLGGIGGVAARGFELFLVPTSPDALPPMQHAPMLGALALMIALPAHAFLPGRPALAALLATLPLLALAAPASVANGVVSDRYFLAAAIGLATAMALLYDHLERRHAWTPLLALLPILWLPFTTLRAADWVDDETLFRASLARQPDNAKALYQVAYHRHTADRDCAGAIPLYARAMSEQRRAGNNLQACLLQLQRPAEAISLGLELAAADPDNPTPALNTARAYSLLGELDAAENWAREGLRRRDTDPRTIVLLGQIVGQRGRHAEALDLFEAALAIDPTSRDARAGASTARDSLARVGEPG